jgi:protein STE50
MPPAEHNISGEVLAILDADSLRELGVQTIGQRLHILKAVYNLKVAQNVPIEPDHYVPPCAPSPSLSPRAHVS